MDEFDVVSVTKAINLLPIKYGRLGEAGLDIFPVRGIADRRVTVEEQNGVLTLIKTAPVGTHENLSKREKRKERTLKVPHIPLDDAILPSEISGKRALGTDNTRVTMENFVAERLARLKAMHLITLEHLRVGALKGIILDADGVEIYNLFTEFGITPVEVDFVLGTAGTNVKAKCMEVKRQIEANLKGDVMSDVRVIVSAEFMDKLTGHAKVIEAYQRWQNGAALRDDMRNSFPFGGLVFEEYNASATDPAGATRRFIAANEGHAFPLGTANTFETLAAPADWEETVNTIGELFYAKTADLTKFKGEGTAIHTQMNPLPICYRPGVLIKVKTSN